MMCSISFASTGTLTEYPPFQMNLLIDVRETDAFSDILTLMETISRVNPEGFKIYLPDIIPIILTVLNPTLDKGPMVQRVLDTIVAIGPNLGTYNTIMSDCT